VLGLPFGGQSPFSAEVWFVNKVTNLDVKWGTLDPIQLQDPRYQLMVPVRAFGQYGIRINDSKRFLLKLVGTVRGFDVDTLAEYFRGAFITRIKTEIANLIITQGRSVLEVATHLQSLSDGLKQLLETEVASYGVTLAQFNVHSINVPEDDSAVVTLKAAMARRAEMGIVGFTYQQERSFDVMQTAAGNEGTAGSVLGAGMGLGMGVSMGGPIGQALGNMGTQIQLDPVKQDPPAAAKAEGPRPNGVSDAGERIRLLKELAALRAEGILTEEEFAAEKRRMLNS
jgi:membrane protease subunit (stomatin/prohibitin family)